MKKLLVVAGKALAFFVGWALLASFLPIPSAADGAVWRFWAELIPFLAVVACTAIFWIGERRRLPRALVSSPLRNGAVGILAGTIWVGTAVAILCATGTMGIIGCTRVPLLGLWLVSLFLNTMMQELLVRGYLYQLLRASYGVSCAAAVTTAMFTVMHGGIFSAGVVPVLGVVTMSLAMTAVLERTGSLVAPVLMHFVWDLVGGLVLGGVSLADDYPTLCTIRLGGPSLLAGGTAGMEGSVVVLALNAALILAFTVHPHRSTADPTAPRRRCSRRSSSGRSGRARRGTKGTSWPSRRRARSRRTRASPISETTERRATTGAVWRPSTRSGRRVRCCWRSRRRTGPSATRSMGRCSCRRSGRRSISMRSSTRWSRHPGRLRPDRLAAHDGATRCPGALTTTVL